MLGHADIKTTRIYLHALNKPDSKLISPLDRVGAKTQSLSEATTSGERNVESKAEEGLPSNARTSTAEKAGVEQPNANHEESFEPDGVASEGVRAECKPDVKNNVEHGGDRRATDGGSEIFYGAKHLNADGGFGAKESGRLQSSWWSRTMRRAVTRASALAGCLISLAGIASKQ